MKTETKMKPATALPHIYGYGSRLSSAYTAGVDGKPHAKHFGGMNSKATKAWLAGRNERNSTETTEKDRRANAYPELVAALRNLMLRCDGEEGVRADGSNIQTMQASALLAKLGEG